MVDVTERANPDSAALELFQQQWHVYRKFLKHDYLSNAGACAALHRYLTTEVDRPFRFVDLACGDASSIVVALGDTPVAHYRGVDLSEPALAMARANLAMLPCTVELNEADFAAALRGSSRAEDIIWISLSLHHLDTGAKLAFMREARSAIDANGAFLVYEPTRRDGEGRAEYLDRFEGIGRHEWTQLTTAEFAEGMKHVRTCDLPETVSDWGSLGREAGFSAASELYKSPTDLFRLFLYRPCATSGSGLHFACARLIYPSPVRSEVERALTFWTEIERAAGRLPFAKCLRPCALAWRVADGFKSAVWKLHLMDRITGTVKFFNFSKGFGFVQPSDGSKDVFLHVSALERAGINGLNEGDKITFVVEDDRRGRGKQAAQVELA